MKILEVRNVQQALPRAVKLIKGIGERRESRNGPVLQAPYPIVTVYERPLERVVFWPTRDANPFFHLYEMLWMVRGRNDVAGPARYAKQMLQYSDDGTTMHGAYGYRWRHPRDGSDQLPKIAQQLKANPDDRRCVLQMWDAHDDLGGTGKDYPCNVTATFQRNSQGALDLTVFCRSNDIIWGAYGANAVHFSFLLEYMALWIGCPVGVYRQISVNWHAYMNDVWEKVKDLDGAIDSAGWSFCPYAAEDVRPALLRGPIHEVDQMIEMILETADETTHLGEQPGFIATLPPWVRNFYYMLEAHRYYRQKDFDHAIWTLNRGDNWCDWIVAGKEWMLRRAHKKQD